MNCTIWNAFFDWAWLPIAVIVLVWAYKSTINEAWTVANVLRFAAGLIFAGGLIVLLAVSVINSGWQSPCKVGDNGVEEIQRIGR